jgi:SAM-dependent methyltransferase
VRNDCHVTEYWNHNTAYHPWILRIAAAHRGRADVLDVGCGEGLAMQRLAPVAASVTGIDPDVASLARAKARLAATPNTHLVRGDFLAHDFGTTRFALVTFVASVHHMDLHAALTTARSLLRPDGELAVVGLFAPSAADYALGVLQIPVVRLAGLIHHESRDIGVPTAGPRETLAEIRAVATGVVPGARIRRGLYYRYLLRWTQPAGRD